MKISQEIKNTGIVVTTDLGNCKDIHPAKKGAVAKRLANWAFAKEYKFRKTQHKSATYKSMKIDSNKAKVNFNFYNKDYFLAAQNIKGFAIAGADQVFYPAKVIVSKNKKSTILQSDKVLNPVAVRYGFENCFESNLKTRSGLPISVFRTDNW